jgi:hypothetical protein
VHLLLHNIFFLQPISLNFQDWTFKIDQPGRNNKEQPGQKSQNQGQNSNDRIDRKGRPKLLGHNKRDKRETGQNSMTKLRQTIKKRTATG